MSGTLGHLGIDLRALNSRNVRFLIREANTAGCESAISYIILENSVLLHRSCRLTSWPGSVNSWRWRTLCCTAEAPDEERYQVFQGKNYRHTTVHEQMSKWPCSGFSARLPIRWALMCVPWWAPGRVLSRVLDIRKPTSIVRWPPPACFQNATYACGDEL